jgi:3-ketoacyl-CoA synthase
MVCLPFHCSAMGWGPDDEGINGVYLRKTIPKEGARAIELCMRTVTPKVMTWSQIAGYSYNWAQRNVLGQPVEEYIPDYTKCVDHFALHCGETVSAGGWAWTVLVRA